MATNGTISCSEELYLGFSMLYLTIPLNLAIVCKSVLVIVTVSRTPTLHTNTNILVTSACGSDLILGIAYAFFGYPDRYKASLSVQESRAITNFMYGEFNSAIIISIVHKGLIAIERYIIIAHPFCYIKHVTKKCVFISLLVVWMFGLVLLFIPLLIYTDDKYHTKCILLHSPVQLYTLGTSVYFASLITILVCYFRIARVAFRHKKAANTRRLQQTDNNFDILLTRNLTAALRSVKFFALKFGVFLLCTAPPVIVSGMSIVYSIPVYVFVPIMFLVPVNSLLGFVIYYSINKSFSKAVVKTFSDVTACLCQRKMEIK